MPVGQGADDDGEKRADQEHRGHDLTQQRDAHAEIARHVGKEWRWSDEREGAQHRGHCEGKWNAQGCSPDSVTRAGGGEMNGGVCFHWQFLRLLALDSARIVNAAWSVTMRARYRQRALSPLGG